MIKLVPDSDIKITKSICGAFDSGFCFAASNPLYSGHYETFDEALSAAERDKQKICTSALPPSHQAPVEKIEGSQS